MPGAGGPPAGAEGERKTGEKANVFHDLAQLFSLPQKTLCPGRGARLHWAA